MVRRSPCDIRFFSAILFAALAPGLVACESRSSGGSGTPWPDGGGADGATIGDATPGDATPDAGDALTPPRSDGVVDPDGPLADGAEALDDADAGPVADVPLPDALGDGLDDGAVPDGDAPADATPDDGAVTPEADAIPQPDVVAPYAHCSEPGGARNIYDLQDPQCPDHFVPEPIGVPGQPVVLSGVVVTGVFSDTFYVQEPEGGPYSGIAVFAHGKPLGALAPGNLVDVAGDYSEFYDCSQLYLESFTKIGEVGVPAPFVPDHPSHIATQGALAEMFEGVLVRVEDVETTNTRPDCPHEFGEFAVTGDLRIDNMGFKWTAHLGDVFASITGPLHYSFGNFKIEPRGEADLVVVSAGTTSVSKCIQAECIELPETLGSQQAVVTEIMPDPYGEDQVQEWFEVHNPTATAVDLDGWTIRDCATQQLELSGTDLVIQPGGFIVFGVKKDPMLNGDVPVDRAYGTALYLPNTVGAILLYDAAGKLVDQTRYSAFEPWEAFVVGHSIERVAPKAPGAEPTSWVSGATVWGATENHGTPGAPNDAWD